jgi:hypothetical protein
MSIELHSTKMPRPQVNPLNAREKKIVKVSLGMVIVVFILHAMTVDGSPTMKWVRHREALAERNRIAAVMNPLARDGNPDAVIWHALNYPDAPLEPLRKLASAGNPHAQWVLAVILESSNRPEAFRLTKMAADGGYPDAVNYEIQTKAKAKDDQS